MSKQVRDERGAVVVLTAACMVVFIGVLAITVDLAHIRAKRAHAQGAADNAALAAAWRTCKSLTSGQAAAVAVAVANDYPASDVTVAAEGTDGWRVTIDTGVDGVFSGVLGVDSLDTEVTAVAGANCSPGVTAIPAAYASGDACMGDSYNAFKISGASNKFTGDVVTGQDIDVSGMANKVYGDLKIGRDIKIGDDGSGGANPNWVTRDNDPDTPGDEAGDSGGHVYYGRNEQDLYKLRADYPPVQQTYTAPTVPTWNEADFTSGAKGTFMTSLQYVPGGKIKSGLYVLSGTDIIIDKSSAPGGVTIVATDPAAKITVKNNVTLTPFIDSLLFANWHDNDLKCGGQAVYVENNSAHLTGVIYAPNAGVYVKGSFNTLSGGTIARWVSVEGSNNRFISSTGSSLPTQFLQVVE
jgi:Flp pilus assembly protein TadG